MRLACVFAPQLALQAALRRDPEARGQAVALFDDAAAPGPGAKVTAATSEARRAGVRTGMTAAQARAACPALRLSTSSTADLAAAEAALADVGYSFAPRIDAGAGAGAGTRTRAEAGAGDDAGDGRIFFDIGDLQRIYPAGEGAIAQAIQAQAARVGLGVRVAVASSKGIARVATRARELAVVPRGGERAFLAPLPARVLADEGHDEIHDGSRRGQNPRGKRSRNGRAGARDAIDSAAALERWGIKTVGALAALPAAEVALRLGQGGARLHRLATGADDEPFTPRLPADAVEEGTDLDYAIYEIEPLSFVLRGLIDRALARLACRSLACAGLTLRLRLDPRGLDVREIPIAAPTRESATLLQLCRLDLARRPPVAGVVGAALIALPARVRTTQLDFLRPAGPAPDRLAATIARLAALVGPDNVGAPRAEETWREEAVGVAPFAVTPGATTSPAATRTPHPDLLPASGEKEPDGAIAAAAALRTPHPDLLPASGEKGPDGKGAATAVAVLLPREELSTALTRRGSFSLSMRKHGEGRGEVWKPEDAQQTPPDAVSAGVLGVRRFRPAQEVEVLIGRDGPTALRGRETTARVLVAAGPYRLSGEWWRTPGEDGGDFCRDCWDVHASDGAVYRLRHDQRDDRWYLDGYYD